LPGIRIPEKMRVDGREARWTDRKIQGLQYIKDRRDLGIHSDVITDGIMDGPARE
jgi:hypothetical protein